YAHASSLRQDERFEFVYPLREWGWDRSACAARIEAEGLPVPPKSACFYCSSSRPSEIRALPKHYLRRIVLMEARAEPRLRNIDGLWRKPVRGMRGATPRPGSMTEFIRQEGLLPAEQIDRIRSNAPADLVRWRDAMAELDAGRTPISRWVTVFDALAGDNDEPSPLPALYEPAAA